MSESHFIKCYPKVIDKTICKKMIVLYERLWNEETERIKQMSLCYDTKGNKTCGACDCQRLDVMQHNEFQPYVKMVVRYLQATIEQYKKDVNIHKVQWPANFGYEHIRIKRYLGDSVQQHDIHSDVNNKDSAKRFLAVICYLNEDFEGGETVFPQFNIKTQVETGNILLFPCTWSYLHKGNVVTKGYAKYIVGTFLNYVDNQSLNRIGDVTLGTKGI